MRYRGKSEHQRQFLPVMIAVSNNILPLWYLRQAYDAEKPNFQLSQGKVVVELAKAYSLCKTLSRGPEQQTIVWIVDVEEQIHVCELFGESREEVVATLQLMYNEMAALPHVTMILNNPTFEIWLQLHYERLSRAIEIKGEAVRSRVQQYIPGYVRERAFFHEGENIYAKTGERMATAMVHANELTTPDFPDLKCARTMMPLVMSLFKKEG